MKHIVRLVLSFMIAIFLFLGFYLYEAISKPSAYLDTFTISSPVDGKIIGTIVKYRITGVDNQNIVSSKAVINTYADQGKFKGYIYRQKETTEIIPIKNGVEVRSRVPYSTGSIPPGIEIQIEYQDGEKIDLEFPPRGFKLNDKKIFLIPGHNHEEYIRPGYSA